MSRPRTASASTLRLTGQEAFPTVTPMVRIERVGPEYRAEARVARVLEEIGSQVLAVCQKASFDSGMLLQLKDDLDEMSSTSQLLSRTANDCKKVQDRAESMYNGFQKDLRDTLHELQQQQNNMALAIQSFRQEATRHSTGSVDQQLIDVKNAVSSLSRDVGDLKTLMENAKKSAEVTQKLEATSSDAVSSMSREIGDLKRLLTETVRQSAAVTQKFEATSSNTESLLYKLSNEIGELKSFAFSNLRPAPFKEAADTLRKQMEETTKFLTDLKGAAAALPSNLNELPESTKSFCKDLKVASDALVQITALLQKIQQKKLNEHVSDISQDMKNLGNSLSEMQRDVSQTVQHVKSECEKEASLLSSSFHEAQNGSQSASKTLKELMQSAGYVKEELNRFSTDSKDDFRDLTKQCREMLKHFQELNMGTSAHVKLDMQVSSLQNIIAEVSEVLQPRGRESTMALTAKKTVAGWDDLLAKQRELLDAVSQKNKWADFPQELIDEVDKKVGETGKTFFQDLNKKMAKYKDTMQDWMDSSGQFEKKVTPLLEAITDLQKNFETVKNGMKLLKIGMGSLVSGGGATILGVAVNFISQQTSSSGSASFGSGANHTLTL